jgi:hypothetical protein
VANLNLRALVGWIGVVPAAGLCQPGFALDPSLLAQRCFFPPFGFLFAPSPCQVPDWTLTGRLPRLPWGAAHRGSARSSSPTHGQSRSRKVSERRRRPAVYCTARVWLGTAAAQLLLVSTMRSVGQPLTPMPVLLPLCALSRVASALPRNNVPGCDCVLLDERQKALQRVWAPTCAGPPATLPSPSEMALRRCSAG